MRPVRRRHLPSLGALATFEVAAKHLSFTLAAKELNITQGAVSQQIRLLETALEGEIEDHLGYPKHAPEGRNTGNSRNGSRSKTVRAEVGEVEIAVPRDREGSFEPQIVKKRQRRLGEVDEIVLSLYAKGLTTGEISAHFAEVYGASISKDTVSRITDRVVEEMQAWCARPLQGVYAAIFIDAIYVKVRDGQVGSQPFYAAIGVDLNGHRDVLGLWAGHGGGESAKSG